MEEIRIAMIKKNMQDIPDIIMPDGYKMRNFVIGEEHKWAKVESDSGEFGSGFDKALARFNEEFGDHIDEMQSVCFFLTDNNNEIIGTATAWYDNDFMGKKYGRLHWVVILPQYQNKGLGKAMVGHVLKFMAKHHSKAYLYTESSRISAIKIYLDFGFEPFIVSENCTEGWKIVAENLQHPKLSEFFG